MTKIIFDKVVVVEEFVVSVACIVHFDCNKLEADLDIERFAPFEEHIYNLAVLGI